MNAGAHPAHHLKFSRLMSPSPTYQETGDLIARSLRRSWEPDPALELPPPECLARALPEFARGGGTMLLYHRLRAAPAHAPDLLERLRGQYRIELLNARRRERCLAETVQLLRDHGVEPLLIKGWAVARLYPDAALRPYGDLDLCVADSNYDRAYEVLRGRENPVAPVELHAASGAQGDLRYASLFERSDTVTLHGVEIRIPSEEEHLRLMALHLLGHGAWRPMWLCDLGVAVEHRSAGFDWDRCLHGNRRLSHWVLTALALAGDLLGARLNDTPAAGLQRQLPGWMRGEVLEAWGRAHGANMDVGPGVHLADGNLRGFLHSLHAYRRNGIQASFELRAPANGFLRLPIRIAATLARVPAALGKVVQYRRDANRRQTPSAREV